MAAKGLVALNIVTETQEPSTVDTTVGLPVISTCPGFRCTSGKLGGGQTLHSLSSIRQPVDSGRHLNKGYV